MDKRKKMKKTVKVINEETGEEELTLDLRQGLSWKYYTNPKSDSFGNAYKSSIKAGYSHNYASNITTTKFWKRKLRKLNMLGNAELVMDKALTMDTLDKEGRENAELLRIQTDMAKFIGKTLGKDEGFSERTEVTGKDGAPVVFMPSQLFDKYNLGTKEEE